MAHLKSITALGLTTVLGLAACTYIIPAEPSAPRYNQVVGDRHKPQQNVFTPTPPMSDDNAAVNNLHDAPATPGNGAMNTAPTAPVTPVAENNLPPLPPVDASTQAQAHAMAAPIPAPDLNARHAPTENPETVLAANDAAPAINSVPPRPAMTGDDAASTRLTGVRHELEGDRATSRDLKAQLDTDATKEPSMLSEMPARVTPPEQTGTVPVAPTSANLPAITPVPDPAPVQLSSNAPIMTPPPALTPLPPTPSVVYVPPAAAATPDRIAIADTTPPAPPVPVAPGSTSFSPLAVAAATPAPAPALPPIVLSAPPSPEAAPMPEPAPIPAPASAPVAALAPIQMTPPPAPVAQVSSTYSRVQPLSQPMQEPTGSSFDPFAVSSNTHSARATYASSDLLPPSRYADKRD